MLEFLMASPNLPFTLAVMVVLLLAAVEVVTFAMGLGLSSFVDEWLPEFDAGGDGPGADVAAGGHAVLHALSWLGLGRVPFLVLLILFLTSFGVIGLVGQYLALVATGGGWMMPAWVGWLPVLLLAAPVTGWLARGVARVVPREVTTAVSEASFVGRMGTISLGTARAGAPTQAKVRDEHGRTHYVLVEPRYGGDAFHAGDEVVLVAGERGRFLVVAGPLAGGGAARGAAEITATGPESEAPGR